MSNLVQKRDAENYPKHGQGSNAGRTVSTLSTSNFERWYIPMKENTVYLMESGGGIGCTEKLYMAIPDFTLVFNDRQYRFDATDGNLSILCINGVDEKIGVKQGYKNLVITQSPTEWNPYEERRKAHLSNLNEARNKGCSECGYCCTGSLVYDNFCTATGESFRDGMPTRGDHCPFKD